jgi:hypothetical protein
MRSSGTGQKRLRREAVGELRDWPKEAQATSGDEWGEEKPAIARNTLAKA